MSDTAFDKQNAAGSNADNLAQNTEGQDEALARELNTDESMTGGPVLEEDPTHEDELLLLKTELDEAKDKYLRLVAEFENFRKRNAKERVELVQTAGRDVLQSMLDVLDDTERATKQMETSTDIEVMKQGVLLVFNKFKNTLHSKGLTAMDSMNQPFDPELHEAITEIPAPNPDMVGKVVDVLEQGYYLNGKLIRYAKVVVGK
ncbi:MAG: nucleotide exchange factor GrpE [Bacteroidota bacterium]